MSNGTLLIIGGTGFFGKTFCQAFLDGKLSKFGVKRLTLVSRRASAFAKENNLAAIDGLQFQNINTSKPFDLPVCSYLMHFAASTSKASYSQNAMNECENITSSLKHTVSAIQNAVEKPSHVLMASSGAVYGPTSERLFSEKDKTGQFCDFGREKKSYAAAKLKGEELFKLLSGKELNLTIARCFSFVGPELPLESHFVAGNLIHNILTRSPLRISAQSPIYRSYLHTDDLVNWLCQLTQKGNPTCPIVNVGSGDIVSIQELARKLATIYDLPVDIAAINHSVEDLYVPNVSLARRLGLTATKSSVEAVSHTVDVLSNLKLRNCIQNKVKGISHMLPDVVRV